MVSTALLPNYLQRIHTIRLHSVAFLHRYSTATQQPQPPSIVENYLINSIGFTPEAASTVNKKLGRHKSFRNDPDLVLDFFKKLGLNDDQIKSMISTCPKLLTYDVNKTLKPKILVFQNIGLSGSDLVKMICSYKSLLSRSVESQVKQMEFLMGLLGSYEKVARAVRNYSSLLHNQAQEKIESGVSTLRKVGFSDQHISHLLMHFPSRIYCAETKWLQDVLHRVEHDLGIPRDSAMFFHGFKYLSFMTKSTMDEKFGVFRSFGWDDATIQGMVRSFPSILGTSKDKLRKCLSFFMEELGYSTAFLASNPVLFCLSFEKMKLRSDVLKVLNEKKLNQRKTSSFCVLRFTDQKFLDNYLLPHKSEIPFLYKSYTEKFCPQIKEKT